MSSGQIASQRGGVSPMTATRLQGTGSWAHELDAIGRLPSKRSNPSLAAYLVGNSSKSHGLVRLHTEGKHASTLARIARTKM